MSEHPSASPFAPPRAGRSAGFWRAWFASRRRMSLANRKRLGVDTLLHLPWIALIAFCVPLFGLIFSPHRLLRVLAPPLFAVAVVLALAGYGERLGGVAFGVVIAIHAACVGAYIQAASPAESILYRVARQTGIALIIVTAGLFLIPEAMSSLVIRVPSRGDILLINPQATGSPYHSGEPMAFLLQSYDGALERPLAPDFDPDAERTPDNFQHRLQIAPGIVIETGLYLGRVIAGPGDRVTFAKGFFSVNDGPRKTALPLMPTQGDIRVPATRVLVWPSDLHSRIPRGYGGHFPPEGLLLRKSALVGRPYKRWFWRTFHP